MPALVLASGSPRRRDLLRVIGLEPQIEPADIDETPLEGEGAATYVERLAREKATTPVTDLPVVAADTAVVLDGRIIGKPIDRDDAEAILRSLSGCTHQVLTGLAVRQDADVRSVVVTTDVDFVDLSNADIDRYLATDEPWDKAGAYGMQGAGGLFVAEIRGNPSNVIGLPLADLWRLAKSMGIDLFA